MLPQYLIENIIRQELSFREAQSLFFRSRAKTGDIFVPEVYQPVIEPEVSTLRFIFVEPGAAHLVFADEVAPDGELDRRYRDIRREQFGRVTDVESVEFASGRVVFRDDYSGINLYETSLHYAASPMDSGMLFTNTWNHLLSACPQLSIQLRGGYRPVVAEVRGGSRQDAEAAPT
jgi:hypothetical protein